MVADWSQIDRKRASHSGKILDTHTHTHPPTYLAREVNWLWKWRRAGWSEESSVVLVLVWEEKSCFSSGEWIEPRIFQQQQQQKRKKPPQRRRSDVVIRSSLLASKTGDWAPKVTSMWLIWFVTEYCSGTCWEILCLVFSLGLLVIRDVFFYQLRCFLLARRDEQFCVWIFQHGVRVYHFTRSNRMALRLYIKSI